MLITKEVEVRIRPNNIKHYESLGYDIPIKTASDSVRKKYKKDFVYDFDNPIIIKVEDLPKGSDIRVIVACDYCGKECSPRYVNYCHSIETDNMYACADCSIYKIEKIMQKKYGASYYTSTQEFKEKVKNTMMNRYGVSHVSKSEEFLKRKCDNNKEKYGFEHVLQVKEFREKGIQTNIDRYGVPNVNQNKEIRAKAVQTLYVNHSQSVSKQQKYIGSLYNGILNFSIKSYNVDIYLFDDNFIVEYDGGGHMLNVVLGQESIENFKQKEIIRNNIIKKEGYKQMRIISSKDLIPSDQILLQMLNEAKQYFIDYPNYSWIEYDIDNSIVRNAEHKDGISYNYGKLRKIKDSDLSKSKESIV